MELVLMSKGANKVTGKIFQEIREKKNQTIMNTSEGIVTPQSLRKYERDNGDIRFSNLIQLLNRLNTTIDEFVFEIDESMDCWFYLIEEEIDQAYHAGNSFLLKKFVEKQERLYQETSENRFLFAAIIGKRFYNYIFLPSYTVDLSPIADYLRETETWGKFEFFLITYNGDLFKPEEAYYYAKKLVKQDHGSFEVRKWRHDAVLHLARYLIEENQLASAEKILLEYLNNLSPNRDMKYLHYDLYAKFVYGLLLIKKNDPKGPRQCERIIEIFVEDCGYLNYGNRLNIIYQSTVAQVKKAQ